MINFQIIIEGCDGTGKTTLANFLKSYIKRKYNKDISIIHCTGEDPKDYNFYSQLMRKENVIFDRHFIGEMVYGNIDRKESKLSCLDFDKLAVQSRLQQVIIIYCNRNIESIFETLEDRLDTHYLSKKERMRLFEIQQSFDERIRKLKQYHNEVFLYDIDNENCINELIEKIF